MPETEKRRGLKKSIAAALLFSLPLPFFPVSSARAEEQSAAAVFARGTAARFTCASVPGKKARKKNITRNHGQSTGAAARDLLNDLYRRFEPEADDIQNVVTGSYGGLQLARLCADKIEIFSAAYPRVQKWIRGRLPEKVAISTRCGSGDETVFDWERERAFVPLFCDFVTAVYMEKAGAFGPAGDAQNVDAKKRFYSIVSPAPDESAKSGLNGPPAGEIRIRVRAYSDRDLFWHFKNVAGKMTLYKFEYAARGCD
jgi:hypothetical protein